MTISVQWIDSGREPQCQPDPDYPNGKDLRLMDMSRGFDPLCTTAGKFCKVDLPYPAKRCGIYVISCSQCGCRAGVTTAGRPDDPKSVEIPCQETQQ